jgi:hypothetical protein
VSKNIVTGEVTLIVVELLEVIEVDHDKGVTGVGALYCSI